MRAAPLPRSVPVSESNALRVACDFRKRGLDEGQTGLLPRWQRERDEHILGGSAIARLEADASSNKLLHLLEAEGVAVDEDGKGLFVELLLLLDLGDGQVAKAHRQEEGTRAPQRDNLSQLDK